MVTSIFLGLHLDHLYPFWKFFPLCKLRESCPRVWQTSIHTDVATIVNTAFLQRNRSCGHVNILQRSWECFFLRQVELNSWFIVVTINEVTLDRPKVSSGFSVNFCFCRLKPFRFVLKFSTKIFALYKLFSLLSWFSEFVVSYWQFCCTILRRRIPMGSGICIIKGAKLQKEVLHDVDNSIFHSWSTNLLCFFPRCRLLRFQHHLLVWGFRVLSMTVLDDEEFLDLRLQTEIRNFLSRTLLDVWTFWREFLWRRIFAKSS